MGNSQVKTQDPRASRKRVQAPVRSMQEALQPLPPSPPPKTSAAAADDDDDESEDEKVQQPSIVQRQAKQHVAAASTATAAVPRSKILFKSQRPLPQQQQQQQQQQPSFVVAPAIPAPAAPAEPAISPASSSLPHESPNLHLGPPIEPHPFASHPASAPARLQPSSGLSHSQPTPSRRLHQQLKTQHPHRVPFSLEHKSFRRGFVRANPLAAAAAPATDKYSEDDERSVASSSKDDDYRSVSTSGDLKWSQSSDDASLSPAAAAAPDTHDPATFSEAQLHRRQLADEEALHAQGEQKRDRSLQYIPASNARTFKDVLQYAVFNGLMRESEAFHPSLHAQMRRERAQTMEGRPQPNLDQKLQRNPRAPADPDEGEAEYLAPAEMERQKRAQQPQQAQQAQKAHFTPARAVTFDLSQQSQDSDETYAPTQPQPRMRKHRNEQPRSRQLAEAFASGHD